MAVSYRLEEDAEIIKKAGYVYAGFAGLLKYEKEEYYASHPEIFLTTEDGVRIYEVTEAFCLDADTQRDFFDFLDSGKNEKGDSLLFLTTCEYTAKNGRFVVAAVEKNN